MLFFRGDKNSKALEWSLHFILLECSNHNREGYVTHLHEEGRVIAQVYQELLEGGQVHRTNRTICEGFIQYITKRIPQSLYILNPGRIRVSFFLGSNLN